MLNTNRRINKHKVRLLNLAEDLSNVSKARQVMGLFWVTFYRYKSAVEGGGVEALLGSDRRKPNPKPRGVEDRGGRHSICDWLHRLKVMSALATSCASRVSLPRPVE